MGKSLKAKSTAKAKIKHGGKSTTEPSQSVRDFFIPGSPSIQTGCSASADPKMAPGQNLTDSSQEEGEESPICKRDLNMLREDIHTYFTKTVEALLAPLNKRIEEVASELEVTSKMAEHLAEISLSLKEEVKQLKAKESLLNTKIISLENRWRALNLKFQGIREGVEENIDLAAFMSQWLTRVFKQEGGVSPAIAKAQGLGPLLLARKEKPRDILVQFLYPKTREKILKEARLQAYFLFEGQKVIVLLDLPAEALEKRRSLKFFTSKLYQANIKFCWSPVSDILVYKGGTLFKASNITTGKLLLQNLNLKLTRREEEDLGADASIAEEPLMPEAT